MACALEETPADWPDHLQEQGEELEALQSIYQNTNLVQILCQPLDHSSDVSQAQCIGAERGISKHLDRTNHSLYVLQFTVPTHLERDSIDVETWIPFNDIHPEPEDNNGTNKPQYERTISGGHWHASFSVSYLAPFSLQVTLPMSYPSVSPPRFTLSCLWLDASQISLLCGQLDALWEANSCMPILFTWIDWLEQESIRYLGIADSVRLCAVDSLDPGQDADVRALPGCSNPRQDMIYMLHFDMEEEYREFKKTNHNCDICFEEKLGTEFFRISECKHHFCQECMTSFCDMHVRDGTVTQLSCPAHKCTSSLPVTMLQSVLGEEEYQRWERLQLQKALETMGDIAWCPRCVFPVVCEEMNLAQCTQCHYSFCSLCSDTWHQGEACATIEDKLNALEEGTKSQTKASKIGVEKARRLKLELLSAQVVQKCSKPCPGCKIDIEKNMGCNKITCVSCGSYMCWECGKSIAGYDHFTNNKECQLFVIDQPVAFRPLYQRPVAEGALRVRDHLRGNPQDRQVLVHCGRCGQRNLKEGRNNHIRCWSCRCNFCFLCKKSFQMLSQHFSATGCPQHS